MSLHSHTQDLTPLVAALNASAIGNADVFMAVLAATAMLVPNPVRPRDESDADLVARLAAGNAVQMRKAQWHGRTGARLDRAAARVMEAAP